MSEKKEVGFHEVNPTFEREAIALTRKLQDLRGQQWARANALVEADRSGGKLELSEVSFV